MNGYEPATPRAAMGLAALAMAAITLGTFVVLPAKFDSLGTTPDTLAARKSGSKVPIDIATDPGHAGKFNRTFAKNTSMPIDRLAR